MTCIWLSHLKSIIFIKLWPVLICYTSKTNYVPVSFSNDTIYVFYAGKNTLWKKKKLEMSAYFCTCGYTQHDENWSIIWSQLKKTHKEKRMTALKRQWFHRNVKILNSIRLFRTVCQGNLCDHLSEITPEYGMTIHTCFPRWTAALPEEVY